MKVLKVFLVTIFVLILAACSKPVPVEKADYVGKWRGPTMVLLISQDGRVVYKRARNGGIVSIDAPIKRFEGDDFIVGVGPVATTFVVANPPHLNGENWKMTVDGEELTRVR